MGNPLLKANQDIEAVVSQLSGPEAWRPKPFRRFHRKTLILFFLIAQQTNAAVSGILLLCTYNDLASKVADKAVLIFPLLQTAIEELIFRALLTNEPLSSVASGTLVGLHMGAIVLVVGLSYFTSFTFAWIVNYLCFSLIQILVFLVWTARVASTGVI